ncbi:unnamed protein product [Euphydryas editha]|uniref:L1 transposable element RRM domain-containing protein n=1 Tax=Euphydryas editha TaxID=104508 RepID=A0AAU9V180_EUPED|nr:unnamed protein product [Euphydryas editha]
MSVQRSPTRPQLPSTSALTLIGGSQPDLSKISNPNVDTQITFRKRKKPNDYECECLDELKDMRSEISRISSLLEKYIGSNEQILEKMQENITDIKNQISDMKSSNEKTIKLIQNNVDKVVTEINDIKSSTSSMLAEQSSIKRDMTRLEQSLSLGENKIKVLESDLNKLKHSSQVTKLENQLCLGEQIIQEVQNRNNREKNIIIVGLPELTSSKTEESMAKDEADVLNIITSLCADIPKPVKIFRIGKRNPGKNRSIKVCFDKFGPAKQLLRNKIKLSNGIKMYSDRTPAQYNYLKSLQEEIKRRENDGESGLIIKYVHGTPKILKTNAKNDKQR